jgi:hypothetical protein
LIASHPSTLHCVETDVHTTRMNGRSAAGSTSTSAPFGMALVMSRSNPEIIVKVCSPLPMPGCLQVGPVKSMDNEGGKWRIPASKSMVRCAPVGSSECLATIL